LRPRINQTFGIVFWNGMVGLASVVEGVTTFTSIISNRVLMADRIQKKI
jgi:hypothetical protein